MESRVVFDRPEFLSQEPKKSKKKRTSPLTKRTIKYLAVAPSDEIRREVLKSAGPAVIRKLSDFALNAAQGDVKFSKAQQKKLAKYRQEIGTLASRRVPVATKKKILTQEGGAFPAILAAILPTVLSAIGGAIFSR